MTPKETDSKKANAGKRTRTPEKPLQPTPKQDPAEPKPKYVFKIAPADPKNNFDFEDTADK